MTRISVIIPCFNAREWIAATLESVIDQQRADLEVIVVDDGSTDGSAQLVAEAFPSVRLIHSENGGASRARNLGTRVARGEVLQFLDADDLLAPGKLEAQLQTLVETNADIAYGDWQELRTGPDGRAESGRLVARRIEGNADIAVLTDAMILR